MITLNVADSSDSRRVLTKEALKLLQSALSSFGSSLSGDGNQAVRALLDALDDGLSGQLDPAYHLSALDPGTGKTLAVSMFLKAWKAQGFVPHSSVLVGVSRLEEVATYVSLAGLDLEDVAVLTSDGDTNALGMDRSSHSTAPIMFTTQQMIQSRTRGRLLSEAPEFAYQGQSRTLRIWDESILPATAEKLRVDDLGLLASPMRRKHPEFVKALQSLQQSLWAAAAGDTVTVPAALAVAVPPTKAFEGLRGILEPLRKLAGEMVQLVDVGGGDVWLSGAVQALPEDFAPAVVLDASGRVRSTYKLWEQRRGTLRRLPAASNDYRRLHINLWQTGSGQGTLSLPANRSLVVKAMAVVINRDAESEWLIVRYKGNDALFEDLTRLVDHDAAGRLHDLTWGMHHGTNAYAHVRNVMIVGQLTYGVQDYPGLAAAAGGTGQTFTAEELEELRWGEYQHHLFQALCRASVRQSVGGVAGACNAYIITTPADGLPKRLEETFPGVKIVPWLPMPEAPGGHLQAAMNYLAERFANRDCRTVSKADLRAHLSIPKQNVSRICKDARFAQFLGGSHIVDGGRYFEIYRAEFLAVEMDS